MLGVFRQEQADFEQHPPELREEPARRPKAAVNKEAAGTALLLGAGGRFGMWEPQDQGWRRGMERGSPPLGARFCLPVWKGEKLLPEECW